MKVPRDAHFVAAKFTSVLCGQGNTLHIPALYIYLYVTNENLYVEMNVQDIKVSAT